MLRLRTEDQFLHVVAAEGTNSHESTLSLWAGPLGPYQSSEIWNSIGHSSSLTQPRDCTAIKAVINIHGSTVWNRKIIGRAPESVNVTITAYERTKLFSSEPLLRSSPYLVVNSSIDQMDADDCLNGQTIYYPCKKTSSSKPFNGNGSHHALVHPTCWNRAVTE